MHFRRWSLTYQLSVYFAIGSLVLISALGVYLDLALDDALDEEHTIFLAGDIERYRAILAALKDYSELSDESRWPASFKLARDRLQITIFGKNHEVLMASSPLSLPLSALPAPAEIGQRPERSIVWKSPNGEYYRVVSAWAYVGQGETDQALIALAFNVTAEQQLLGTFKDTLLTTLLTAIVFAVALGYFIARRGLLPIRRIAHAASEITSSRLDKKLVLEEAPAELRELAAAFNGMLDRLHESFSRLSQFSSDLAHEFRTPVNNLMGEAQVALTKTRSADEYRTVLESSVDEFERLSRMIENMLFLARADHSETNISAVWIDSRNELENLAEFYQLVADESGVHIKCVGNARVYADPTMFRRAISNLLSNALRYSGKNTEIVMETKSGMDGAATLSVRNPGPAIPPEHLTRIFDRFYRIEQSRVKSSEGSGLGLAIVKTIMQLHGGTVSVDCTSDGLTVFTLWFPAPAKTPMA